MRRCSARGGNEIATSPSISLEMTPWAVPVEPERNLLTSDLSRGYMKDAVVASDGRIAATDRPIAQSAPRFNFPAVAPTTQIKTSSRRASLSGWVVHSRMTGREEPNSPAFTNGVPSPDTLHSDPGGACPITKSAMSPNVVSTHPAGDVIPPPQPRPALPCHHPVPRPARRFPPARPSDGLRSPPRCPRACRGRPRPRRWCP